MLNEFYLYIEEVWLHIRKSGDWTKKLYNYFEKTPIMQNISEPLEITQLIRGKIFMWIDILMTCSFAAPGGQVVITSNNIYNNPNKLSNYYQINDPENMMYEQKVIKQPTPLSMYVDLNDGY